MQEMYWYLYSNVKPHLIIQWFTNIFYGCLETTVVIEVEVKNRMTAKLYEKFFQSLQI